MAVDLRELAAGRHAGCGVEEFSQVEMARIRLSLEMALVCETLPRRLGGGASAAALALDKRVARQVQSLYLARWRALEVGSAPSWVTSEERRALASQCGSGARQLGATVRWGNWLPERYAALGELQREAAAIAVAGGRLRWGRRYVYGLLNERGEIERLVRNVIKEREKIR